MKESQISQIGMILFFIGLIFFIISWYFSYPIHMTEIEVLTITQFSLCFWLAIIFSLIGLFLTGYYSKRKGIKALCASLFPIIFYVYVFYFSYIQSSDSGAAKAMMEIFHQVGIQSSFVSYFQYPIFFTLNEITGQIVGLSINNVAAIFFALYGILLGLYLFLFLFSSIKINGDQIAFFGGLLYFIILFAYLNYQWVPQTLALVFFFFLLLSFNTDRAEFRVMNIIIFIALVFTHAFIPVIFLLFFGLYVIINKKLLNLFLLMCGIYFSVLTYYTTNFLPMITNAFKEAIYGFGGEYTSTISESFKQTTGLLDQIIGIVNRVRIPLMLCIVSIGFFIGLVKKRINLIMIVLCVAGGFYLAVGLVYSVLGLRALQIVVIPLVLGIGFFYTKWEKQTVGFVLVMVILSIFAPMRSCYDQYQFQLNEDENASNFLINKMVSDNVNRVALDGVLNGYFILKSDYIKKLKNNNHDVVSMRPKDTGFYNIFNSSITKDDFIVDNPNLLKEIFSDRSNINYVNNLNKKISFNNNKIFVCGKTNIIKGALG